MFEIHRLVMVQPLNSMSSWHDVPFPGLNTDTAVPDFKLCFRARKSNLRLLLATITAQCYCVINNLWWSDPLLLGASIVRIADLPI